MLLLKTFFLYKKTKPFFFFQGEQGSKGDEGTKVGEQTDMNYSIVPLSH